MKNIPHFVTPWGIASLILEEIPYRGEAFIRIQTVDDACFSQLLDECVSFCRAAGAKTVRAAGHPALCAYRVYATLLKMRCDRALLPEPDCCLWPLLPENAERFRELYNRRMADVPNASTMTHGKLEQLLESGGGYFVHRDGKLLGLGIVSGEALEAVIGVEPGAGMSVTAALASALTCDSVTLTVAAENRRAMRLYTRLGFLPVEETAVWHTVLAIQP